MEEKDENYKVGLARENKQLRSWTVTISERSTISLLYCISAFGETWGFSLESPCSLTDRAATFHFPVVSR